MLRAVSRPGAVMFEQVANSASQFVCAAHLIFSKDYRHYDLDVIYKIACAPYLSPRIVAFLRHTAIVPHFCMALENIRA